MKLPRPSKWGPRTPKPEIDPRAELRVLEGERVGGYDLTVLPTSLLEEALVTGCVTIPGQPETHIISRSSIERVLAAKRGRMRSVGTAYVTS